MPLHLNRTLEEVIRSLIEEYGEEAVSKAVSKKQEKKEILVVVGNCGLHPIPDIISNSEYYCATEGNLNFQNSDSITSEIQSMISRLSIKLREKKWDEVLIVPFGHPVLSMYIKMTVYRVLGINSKELFHKGDLEYVIIDVNDRAFMLEK